MFRGAVRADMARILDIYARAREFMAKNGNPTQWGGNYPSPELLEEDIDTNRLFVYMVNGQMQAVFAFILGEDPTYKVIEDGQWLNDTLPYGTLHRLASAGESKGIGKAVVEWCLEHCESLRADTHADNKVMQHLLESEGFTRCGIIHVADGTPRIAYQKLALTQQRSESTKNRMPAGAVFEPSAGHFFVRAAISGRGASCWKMKRKKRKDLKKVSHMVEQEEGACLL